MQKLEDFQEFLGFFRNVNEKLASELDCARTYIRYLSFFSSEVKNREESERNLQLSQIDDFYK